VVLWTRDAYVRGILELDAVKRVGDGGVPEGVGADEVALDEVIVRAAHQPQTASLVAGKHVTGAGRGPADDIVAGSARQRLSRIAHGQREDDAVEVVGNGRGCGDVGPDVIAL